MLKQEITYPADSATLFAKIAHEPWAIYLDSGQPGSQYGRYDIMAARPFITLSTRGEQTAIHDRQGFRVSLEDPFVLLKQTLKPYSSIKATLPFEGGAIGYFGYDLARRLESLPTLALDAEDMPQMMIGIYDWALIVDHREKRAWLVSHAVDAKTEQSWAALCALFEQVEPEPAGQAESTAFAITSRLSSNMDLPTYELAFDKIKRYIVDGDCYQVNLAQRFSAHARGDAWTAYKHLREISPAPFMAYMSFPELQVLSGSPERFLQVKGDHVETRPIKGTRPRSADVTEDAQNATDLKASLKDRAENLMIVDLLRNDISKSCATGSVRADRLFALESFANVHHLVSTVTGKLAIGMTSIDLLKGCFPGGSITGAPKLRSMEIIEELEPHRRGLYCGAIGYIGFDGNMDTNIAIRTAVYSNNEIRFWAGGGIVADSEMQKEYRETWDKASSMLQLMQHFGAGETKADVP
ncbi:MAG: aminodeoxychorismate synthase component I [Methylophilaceae bacterium]